MTDAQIAAQLAEQVMGWKIPPDESCEKYHERQKFFNDKANYPNYDPTYKLLWRDRSCDGVKWNPFESWNDAMVLAEKWAAAVSGNLRRQMIYVCCPNPCASLESAHDATCYEEAATVSNPKIEDWYLERENSASADSGPRAVTLAVARAVGIEVEG